VGRCLRDTSQAPEGGLAHPRAHRALPPRMSLVLSKFAREPPGRAAPKKLPKIQLLPFGSYHLQARFTTPTETSRHRTARVRASPPSLPDAALLLCVLLCDAHMGDSQGDAAASVRGGFPRPVAVRRPGSRRVRGGHAATHPQLSDGEGVRRHASPRRIEPRGR
jgi:hypothetical protein